MTGIWAVARHTISESVRQKAAAVFIIIIALLVFGLPFVIKGDDSITGAAQSFLAYSLGLIGFLLSLLTIFLARSISDELVGKQILMTATKPLPRWQYVYGKWLGIVLVDFALVLITGVGAYFMVQVIASGKPRDDYDKLAVRSQVLTARHAIEYEVPDFFDKAKVEFERRLDDGAYDNVQEKTDSWRRLQITILKEQMLALWRTIRPMGDFRDLEFEGVMATPDPEKTFQIRYKPVVYNYPVDETITTKWSVGNIEGTRIYDYFRRDAMDRYQILEVPRDAISEDQKVKVRIQNLSGTQYDSDSMAALRIEQGEPVEVLFQVGSFAGNLIRALALMMCRLMLLAALAVAATCMFSFPVATLVTMTVYVMAIAKGFIDDSYDWVNLKGFAEQVTTWTKTLIDILYVAVPNFSKYDGLQNLVDGRNVPLMWVFQGMLFLFLVRTGIVLLIGCLVFTRREVAEVSV